MDYFGIFTIFTQIITEIKT